MANPKSSSEDNFKIPSQVDDYNITRGSQVHREFDFFDVDVNEHVNSLGQSSDRPVNDHVNSLDLDYTKSVNDHVNSQKAEKIQVHRSPSCFEKFLEDYDYENPQPIPIGRVMVLHKSQIKLVGGARRGKTGQKRNASIVGPKPKGKGKKARPKKILKRVAREVGINAASQFVGPDLARAGYQMIARSIRPKQLVLSAGASKYLLAFLKPFDNQAQQASIPRPPATRSFKVTGFIRGSGQIGANGVGFVAMSPCLSNDRPCVWYTTNIFTPTITAAPPSDLDYTLAPYLNGGALYPAAAYMSNLPYDTNKLVSSGGGTGSPIEVVGRIVSSSLRAYYTGTTLNEGGSYYAYSDPDVNNVLGADHVAAAAPSGYSPTNLMSKDATEIVRVKGRTEVSLVRVCTDPSMDDYPRTNNSALRKLYPYAGGEFYANVRDNFTGVANAVIMIDGTPGQPFYFEMVTHVEYIGSGVTQGLLSDTNNDAVGYDCVKNLLQHAQRAVASDPRLTYQVAMKQEMRRQSVVFGTGLRSVDY